MAKVLCTLENASTEISGVKFTRTDVGMLSADIPDELAAEWATIPGYELVDETPPPVVPVAAPSAPAKTSKKTAPAAPILPVETPTPDEVTPDSGEAF